MKSPRQFYQPLAIGAPAPPRELPVRLERMIHFVPPHIEKMRAKAADLARQVDVVLGNLEETLLRLYATRALSAAQVRLGGSHGLEHRI